jgi:hypothetical protein
MPTRKRTTRRKSERGQIALNEPVQPGAVHAVIVVSVVALGGIVVLAVAFAATHAR